MDKWEYALFKFISKMKITSMWDFLPTFLWLLKFM